LDGLFGGHQWRYRCSGYSYEGDVPARILEGGILLLLRIPLWGTAGPGPLRPRVPGLFCIFRDQGILVLGVMGCLGMWNRTGFEWDVWSSSV